MVTHIHAVQFVNNLFLFWTGRRKIKMLINVLICHFSPFSSVVLRHTELLFPNGTVYNTYTKCDSNGAQCAAQTETYWLRGGGVEVYTPRFTYHGFRYVQLEGFPGKHIH